MKKRTEWLFFAGYVEGTMLVGALAGVLLVQAEGWLTGGVLTILLAMVLGLPMVASFVRMMAVLERYEQGLPVPALGEGWLDPLRGLALRVNRLTAAAQQAAGLRDRWLSQTSRQAAQEERNRLARELHDSIKQQLFSIQMSSAAAQARFLEDAAGAQSALADVQRSAHEALVEMNALLQQLSPAPLERVGLAQAVRDQCEALGYRSGAQVECVINDLPGEELLPAGTQEAVFRIVQEALSNTARHARAKHVSLSLHEDEISGEVVMVVRDDGQGFDLKTAVPGSGLEGMRARAAELDGSVKIESAPGLWTLVTLRIPCQPAAEEQVSFKVPVPISRVGLTGLLGGAILSAMLVQPWGTLHAGQFAEIWTPVGLGWSVVLQVLAVILLPVIGGLAARWAKPAARTNAGLYGAFAGGLAAIMVFGLIGATLAGSSGAMPVLLHGLVPTSGGGQTAVLVISSFSNIFLLVHLMFWGLLGMGAGLGWLGGLAVHSKVGKAAPSSRLTPGMRLTCTALAGGGAVGMFVTSMIMPLSEASILDQVGVFTLSGLLIPLRAAVVCAIITPTIFFLAGLVLSNRLNQEEAARAEIGQLFRLQRDTFLLTCLAIWVGLGSGLWAGVYLIMDEIPAKPVTSVILLCGTALAAFVSAVWTGRLALGLRRTLLEAGKPHLSDAESAGWLSLALFPLLALLGVWYGAWMEGLALAALAGGAGLSVYAQSTRSAPKRNFRFWRMQTAEFSAAWPGIAMGFAAPLLPTLASGLAVLTLPVRFVSFLDNHPEVLGLTVTGALGEYALYQAVSFLGLLLLCGTLTGLTGLFGHLRAALNRRSV